MRLVERFVIPKEEGKAFQVLRGQVLRITQIEGPQVVDFNCFNLQNPKEMFFAGRTRIRYGAHLKVGDALLSTPPHEREMMTIVADTVKQEPGPNRSHSHDLIFSRCTKKGQKERHDREIKAGCQENLEQAIAEFGLAREYVHDPFNIFMKTGIDANDKLFHEPPDSKKGDYVDLRAEIDCLVAISVCPGVSSGGDHYPLGIEIFEAQF